MPNLVEHVSSKNNFVACKTKVCSIGCLITCTNLLRPWLIKFVLQARMRAEQSKFLASISTDEDLSSAEEATPSAAVNETRESVQDVCSLCRDSNPENPLSFLIFLQVTSYIFLLFFRPTSSPVLKINVCFCS